MRRFPAALLSIVSIIALAGMGVTYTLWADKLEITGEVHTGQVDVHYKSKSTQEYYWNTPNHNTPGPLVSGEVEGKNVGDCAAALATGNLNGNNAHPNGSANLASNNSTDLGPDLLNIVLTNAYPYYICQATFVVENIGSIPVKLTQPTVSNILNGDGSTAVVVTLENCYDAGTQIEAVGFENAVTPNGPTTATCTIQFVVQEDAVESFNYTATVGSITAEQWNEYFLPAP